MENVHFLVRLFLQSLVSDFRDWSWSTTQGVFHCNLLSCSGFSIIVIFLLFCKHASHMPRLWKLHGELKLKIIIHFITACLQPLLLCFCFHSILDIHTHERRDDGYRWGWMSEWRRKLFSTACCFVYIHWIRERKTS